MRPTLLPLLALLTSRIAFAKLSVDGVLAPGAASYVPTYPSVLPDWANSLLYVAGVVNATTWTTSSASSGFVRARAARGEAQFPGSQFLDVCS